MVWCISLAAQGRAKILAHFLLIGINRLEAGTCNVGGWNSVCFSSSLCLRGIFVHALDLCYKHGNDGDPPEMNENKQKSAAQYMQ